MGNTQSAEAPRRPPTKLTKPRTNTSSTNLLATSSAPSRRSSTLSLPVARNKRSGTLPLAEIPADGEDGALKNKAGSRAQRRNLFRSKSAQPESTAPTDEPPSDLDTNMSSHPLHRYSSMVSVRVDPAGEVHTGASNSRPPVRTTRSAQPYYSQAVQPGRLSLVIEAQSPEPDPQEELKQLGLRHGSFDNGFPVSPISPDSRSNSPDSIPIPIRRRSLLTPGIATRKPSKEKVTRKSIPPETFSYPGDSAPREAAEKRNFRKTLPAQPSTSYDHLREHYYDQSKPASSLLKEIATMESRCFSELQPRTVTPCDLEYSHIGGYKLGSLRITNGTVSPAPSGPEQSYFDNYTQPRGGFEEAEPMTLDLSPRDEQELPGKSYNKRTGTFVNSKQSKMHLESHELADKAPRIVETMVEIPTFSLGLSEFQPGASPRQNVVIESPATASEMAQAYMQEIAASPFSYAESPPPSPQQEASSSQLDPPSPQLEATTKPTEFEDNLFDDEPGSATSLAPVATSAPQPALPYSQRSIETQTSFSSLISPTMKAGNRQQSFLESSRSPHDTPSKPLEKADSGYSSKTSLRSFRSLTVVEASNEPLKVEPLAPPPPVVPDKSPPPTPPKNLYTRYSRENSIISSTVQGSKSPDTEYAPATPAKNWPSRNSYGFPGPTGSPQMSNQHEPPEISEAPQPPHRQAPSVPQKPARSTWSGWTGPPPLPVKSIEQIQAAAKSSSETLPIMEKPSATRRQSTPLVPYDKTMRPGLKSSASDTSISATSRRLQKRIQVAEPGFIVQGCTDIEPSSIPPVSLEVFEHLEERLRNFPTLAHTYKSVHRTNSKETLATIFSMASAEQQAEEVHALSRLQALIPNAPPREDIERSMNVETTRGGHGHGQRFSLMPKILRRSADRQSRRQSLETMSRNRSSSRDTEDQVMYIADLGLVSASLGSNPYDLATTALTPISGNRSHAPVPEAKFEMDTTRGRTIGMDSQSAAQLARERSRSRENERRRSLQRESHDNGSSSEDRLFLPYDQRSKFATETGPPVPNVARNQSQGFSHPKKAKSLPPVSMKIPRKRVSSPPPKPARAAPSPPGDVPQLPEIDRQHNRADMENQRRDANLQTQKCLPHDSKRTAREALSSARQSINPTPAGNMRPSLEKQRQWSSQPLRKRPSLEQSDPFQPKQQSHSHSYLQGQRCDPGRQSFDSSQPRADKRNLARASFDSVNGQNLRHAHPLSQSQSYTQMRSEPLTVDRFNGGFAYDYEHGYGVGGSAGTRSGDTTASRKGVPGSLMWGVDFSDVPVTFHAEK